MSGSGGYDELQRIQLQTDQVVDASLASTRRMLELCDESQKAGARTLGLLNDQKEQLDQIEGKMDQINNDLKEAEKNLKGMEKCCGLCILPCGNRSRRFKEDSSTWKGTKGGRVVNSQPQRVADGRHNDKKTASASAGPFISRITNDAREDEMEDNMVQVSNMLGNMKNMAIDMGTEIEIGSRQIDRIARKAISNDDRMKSANDRANKILKS